MALTVEEKKALVRDELIKAKKLGRSGHGVQLQEDRGNFRLWWAATENLMVYIQPKLKVQLLHVLTGELEHYNERNNYEIEEINKVLR